MDSRGTSRGHRGRRYSLRRPVVLSRHPIGIYDGIFDFFGAIVYRKVHTMKILAIDQSNLAKSGEEYLALLASEADWIARTADDVRQLRQGDKGPLAKLSEDDFTAFLASLEFKRGGVAHGYYKPLMAALTITEIFQVFDRFGMNRDYTLSTLEAKCEGAECVFDFWSFCTRNCIPTILNE